jgi:two-component system phosphate regulon sensor histidine kinase PhoR
VQSDERFYEHVDRNMDFITRTMLAVPLTTKQGVIGALEVINKRGHAPFTPQDVALMEAMASQAAVAIINVHLFNQSDLLAEIMHELKTPLMAISTASELLSRPDFPGEKRSEVVEMIKRESARLSKMTKDFLDFARLESGRVQLDRQPVAIEGVVAEVVAISGSQAEARRINIETRFSHDLPQPDSPFTLIGDRNRLKQVLLNLVSNATKYNRENGSITISVQCPQPDALEIGVADTGKGIAAEDMERLFERFYRIPGSESAEGAGLGLSVAKKIVEEHDGRITVKSAVGTGTTFIVSLPLHKSNG